MELFDSMKFISRTSFETWSCIGGFSQMETDLFQLLEGEKLPEPLIQFSDLESLSLPKGPKIREALLKTYCLQLMYPLLSKEDLLLKIA